MSGNPTHLSKRALKRAHSIAATESRKSKFTTIVEEQGGLCFFCGEIMGSDCTKEHLLAQTLGGGNERENLRAAHGECNSAAGHLPVSDKLRLRETGLSEGRAAMLILARQMRRADARIAFSQNPQIEPSPGLVTFGRLVGPQGDFLDRVPRVYRNGRHRRMKGYRITLDSSGRKVLVVGKRTYLIDES